MKARTRKRLLVARQLPKAKRNGLMDFLLSRGKWAWTVDECAARLMRESERELQFELALACGGWRLVSTTTQRVDGGTIIDDVAERIAP